MRSIIAMLALFSAVGSLRAEDLPTLSLVDLVYRGRVIFTATRLPDPARRIDSPEAAWVVQRFVVRQVIRSSGEYISDTVSINVDLYPEYGQWGGTAFQDYLLFGDYGEVRGHSGPIRVFHPVISGFRPFRHDTIFIPWQNDFDYRFYPLPGNPLSTWLANTRSTISRVDALLKLQEIRPGELANRAIFRWIKQHRQELNADTIPYWSSPEPESDKTWGQLGYDVFSWIDRNGNWQDAWDGMLLSLEIAQHAHTPSSESFLNKSARTFLRQQISTDTKYRSVALNILGNSLIDSPSESAADRAEQLEILHIIQPLLQDPSLQLTALQLTDIITSSTRFEWSEHRDPALIREIKLLREHAQDEYLRKYSGAVIERLERQ